jgi:hypothetical protein
MEYFFFAFAAVLIYRGAMGIVYPEDIIDRVLGLICIAAGSFMAHIGLLVLSF